VQYASATGTGNFSATALPSVSLAPGQYFLVREGGGTNGVPLPTPDASGSTNMSATGGKVIVANTATSLACNGGSTPCSTAQLAQIVDLVGYDGANFFESAPAPTLSNTTAALRAHAGCTDTDNNAADFAAGAPAPRNTASPFGDCEAPTPPTAVGSANPATVPAGGSTVLTAVVTPGAHPVSTGIAVACDLSSIGGNNPQALAGSGNTFTYTATVATGTTPGAKTLQCTVSDAQSRSSAFAIALSVEGPHVAIHDIQGAAHVSPLAGQVVSTDAIVTARAGNGFWLESPASDWDADPATSEGIFVFTSSAPTVAPGDLVHVNGTVNEFRPGGASTANLTTTELSGSPSVSVLSTGNPLPAATIVGSGGRIPPDTVIEDDAASGNVETSGAFDPASDGLDFWESLEGMRVQLNDAVAVGPTNAFGETQIVGDDGANAGVRTARGGLLLRPSDGNPERVVVDDVLVPLPKMNVGDHYTDPVVGVLDYNFGNFFVEATATPGALHDGVSPESTVAQSSDQLAVSTFNVENLAPSDPQSKFDRLAGLIVHNLQSPDLISVEEVQDNSGATDNGVVAADQTIAKLQAAIAAAGGPAYDYREIDPVNDQDGGQPGGNIRQVFFFRTDRGLSFVDRPGGDSTTPTAVVNTPDGPQLSLSPGRIDPANSAWTSSRKPLAGEFSFRGHHLFVIANHFNSKGGDQPLEGRFQPPAHSSEVQRHQQAQLVHDFVAQILADDPNASVVVDGDLNDFEWSDTVHILENGVLHDLMDTLPLNERYSYVFEGNSQTLDHILFSDALLVRPFVFDPVHVNAEFFDQASDHDPSVARITLNDAPLVSAGGPYTVAEGSSVLLSATGSDPEGGPLTFAWDLDGDGTFETAGQSATFSAATLDGPATRTVSVRATDAQGLSADSSALVAIANVPPTATFTAPSSSPAGFAFSLSLTAPSDPSPADTAAGFTYAFDCGSGYGAFTSANTASCPTTATGSLSVGGEIRDKDGGITEYRGSVEVTVTTESLCALTKQYVTKNDGLANSLCAKLDAHAYGAFLNEVRAQTGKALTAAQAEILSALARTLSAQ
jgi:uncharacterized protein